jgi:vacuolar-type H+-ATPase subunit E/Vma4
MGRRELLEALHREGRERMAAIAAREAAEEERLRSRAEESREEQRRAHEQQRAILCDARKRELTTRARREANLVRLRSEHALSLRLHERARICLKQLRPDDGPRLFLALAAELPDIPWRTVWFNPRDAAVAAGRFPGAATIADESVSGGCRAGAADDSITVDNTMEVRLERMWPDLLPHLMAELRGRPI